MGCVCSSSDSPKEAQKHVGIKETNEEKNADVQKQKKDNVGSGETHKREVNASNLIGETEIHEEEGDLSTKPQEIDDLEREIREAFCRGSVWTGSFTFDVNLPKDERTYLEISVEKDDFPDGSHQGKRMVDMVEGVSVTTQFYINAVMKDENGLKDDKDNWDIIFIWEDEGKDCHLKLKTDQKGIHLENHLCQGICSTENGAKQGEFELIRIMGGKSRGRGISSFDEATMGMIITAGTQAHNTYQKQEAVRRSTLEDNVAKRFAKNNQRKL